MMEDNELHDPVEPVEDEELDLDEEGNPKKKAKDLIDDDTESLEDEIEKELDDEEEDDYGDGDSTYE